MARLSLERLDLLLDRIAGLQLLIVGDLVLDEFITGDVERVSPEAPVPVVHVGDESVALGGAANVACNAVALGGRAIVCSMVGDDEAGALVADLMKGAGIDPSHLTVAPGRPTTRKTRIVARGQQVTRLDRECLAPPAPEVGQRIAAAVDAALPRVDAAVLEDYGKGVLPRRFAAGLTRSLGGTGIPVVVDPKGAVSPYRGATLLKPNLREAEALSGVSIRTDADLVEAAARLRRKFSGDVAVTRGGRGMTLFTDAASIDVRTVAREVYDVQGAGDTTAAALALALRAGAELFEAAVIANAAAGAVVGKAGTATASVAEVRALLPEVVAAAEESR